MDWFKRIANVVKKYLTTYEEIRSAVASELVPKEEELEELRRQFPEAEVYSLDEYWSELSEEVFESVKDLTFYVDIINLMYKDVQEGYIDIVATNSGYAVLVKKP
jgi:hypothetical protein